MSVSDLTGQEQALDYFDQTIESVPQEPAGISRIESQIQERDSKANAPIRKMMVSNICLIHPKVKNKMIGIH